jgi:hypothetical protein
MVLHPVSKDTLRHLRSQLHQAGDWSIADPSLQILLCLSASGDTCQNVLKFSDGKASACKAQSAVMSPVYISRMLSPYCLVSMLNFGL